MKHLGRVTFFVVLVVIAVMDIWLISLRCDSSPTIDWSRLGFGLTMQVGVLVGALVLSYRQEELEHPTARRLSLVLVCAASFTFIIVRQPLLLSDTTFDKFYHSGSYKCPGVPSIWKRGK